MRKLGTQPQGESPFLRVRLPKDALEAIRKAARKQGKTVSEWVRVQLEAALKKGR